jgi:O-antigen ligase
MVSIATAMTIYGIKTWKGITPWLNKLLWAFALMFIIYLHVLAVRSGIMTLYVALGCLLIIYIKEKGNKLLAAGITVSSILLIFLATQYVPTIKNKIGYMQYSLEKFAKNENIRELSDSRRLGSIFAGLELTRKNPLLGVGIGDIMDETNAYLAKHYPDLTDLELLPHNQYILAGATLGIIGLLIFVLFSLMPLFYLNGYNDYFLLASQFMFFASFMVEHTIESQIGVALYIFITLMAMKNRETQMTNPHA